MSGVHDEALDWLVRLAADNDADTHAEFNVWKNTSPGPMQTPSQRPSICGTRLARLRRLMRPWKRRVSDLKLKRLHARRTGADGNGAGPLLAWPLSRLRRWLQSF